jgi:hypothetical protein
LKRRHSPPLYGRACGTLLIYSLRSIILFANMDISITKIYLDTSILAKNIMGQREH